MIDETHFQNNKHQTVYVYYSAGKMILLYRSRITFEIYVIL